jgi:hypothetical protein
MVCSEGNYHITFKTMLSLQNHHITDLYVFVDDILPDVSKPNEGRPTILSDSECITILLWNTFILIKKP